MRTSHDETYKIGFDEPFRNISELHKLELGQLLNENDGYREVSSYLGMEQELKQVQNKSNPGYEILSAWSKKNSNSTIRVLSETFKVIGRNDLKEKVDEIRNDYMWLTITMFEEESKSTQPICATIKTPSRKPLIDVVRPEVIKHFQSYLTSKKQIVMSVDGYETPWFDICNKFKGSQVNVRVKGNMDLSITDKLSFCEKDRHCSRDVITFLDSDWIVLSDPIHSDYNNSNPDKHYISHLPGFFEFNREQTEQKLREIPERKYILRYRRKLSSEQDSHLVLSLCYNSVMWHFLILNRASSEAAQFFLFKDGYFGSTVTELLVYYKNHKIFSSTARCPDCCLGEPAA